MSYKLFLDDYRDPFDCVHYMHQRIGAQNAVYKKEWVVARNYDEFVRTITEQGMPSLISFDHDLAEEHYAPEHMWDGNYHQLYSGFKEKTGLDCVRWLLLYCKENGHKLPECLFHTMNPAGHSNMAEEIRNWLLND